MPGSPRGGSRAELPPPEVRAWIETSMRWFVREFGLKAARRPVALPTPAFCPQPFTGNRREIRALLTRVCRVMSVDPWFVIMRLFERPADRELLAAPEQPFRLGQYWRLRDFSVVELDRAAAADPPMLAGIIAHELAHARLLGEGRVGEDRFRERRHHERLTELLTVYLGMGVFRANSARPEADRPRGGPAGSGRVGGDHELAVRSGYLTEPEWGYALACHARLRGETEPDWAGQLTPAMRGQLALGLEYLARVAPGGGLPRSGSGG